jgi:molecular chaperone HtpG
VSEWQGASDFEVGTGIMSHKFQVHLRGLIDLLANHLYSGPEVFLRELLQNAQDAITARQRLDPSHEGVVRVELMQSAGRPATLVVQDNGIGLTESEVHQFLATIGESSKRLEDGDGPTDFIGRFGVGLLACFMVSEEIAVVTKSARDDSPAISWRGRPDGTYSTSVVEGTLAPGTQVYLTCRPDQGALFQSHRVSELLRHYGGLLPHRIELVEGNHVDPINIDRIPWRMKHVDKQHEREAYLSLAERMIDQRVFDAIAIRDDAVGLVGGAYVIENPTILSASPRHRVYLKGMFVSEQADELFPKWAVFIRAIVDSTGLRPSASRDSLYVDEALLNCSESLGRQVQQYLVRLAESRPELLASIVAAHGDAIRAMMVEDPDCYRTFIPYIPFETSDGTMTLPEFAKRHASLLYASTVDEFRQIASIASAQQIGVINAGYVHSDSLVQAYGDFDPEATVERLDLKQFARSLGELSEADEGRFSALLAAANRVLRAYRCRGEVREFAPAETPTLYSIDRDGMLFRSISQAKEVSNSLFAGILSHVGGSHRESSDAVLVFNARNPVIRQLADVGSEPLRLAAVQSLYVQSLLMSHQPMTSAELKLLSDSMGRLIALAVDRNEGNE